jgi:hypothetical protein
VAKVKRAREVYTARAAFLNLAAMDSRRLRALMDEQGELKIETMMSPITGGARRGQVRRGLETELGFTGEAAARSAIGRGFEEIIDRNRDIVSRLTGGLVRDTMEEAGKRAGRNVAFRRQYALRPAVKLQNAQHRLKGSVDYTALRMVGENTLPDEVVGFHRDLAALDDKDTLFHQIQMELAQKASKWVEPDEAGNMRLTAKAPKRLHQMVDLLQESAQAREVILRGLGELADAQIRYRIDAPGAVIKGARWTENEIITQTAIMSSPQRQALRAFLVHDIHIPEDAVDAFLKAVADPGARTHTSVVQQRLQAKLDSEMAKGTEGSAQKILALRGAIRQVPDEVDLHYQRISRLFAGQPHEVQPEARAAEIRQRMDEMLDALGPPDGLDFNGIADAVLKEGLHLPEELRDRDLLASRIRLAYDYLKNGEILGGRDWYDRAAYNVQEVTRFINEHARIQSGKVQPLSERQVAQIFAILSAQDNTVNNVTQVRKALLHWVEHGEVWAGRNPTMRSPEVENVLRGHDWDGRKRSSFYSNIIEDIDPEEYASLMAERGVSLEGDPVTVDMWISRIFGVEQPGSSYDGFERIFQMMAKEMRTKALAQGKKIPPAYYLLKKAGAADAFEYGITKNFGQLQLEGFMGNPRGDKALSALLGDSAGFSLRPSLAPAGHKTGFMVSHGAWETKIPTRKMTAAAIEGFRDAHRTILRDVKGLVGGWRNDDDGFVYLDVSKHFASREEALAYGREQGQLAIADLKAIGKEDWDNAFPETGLSAEQADEIKVKLRGEAHPDLKVNPERISPHAEVTPDTMAALELKRAEKQWDDLIQQVLKAHDFKNTAVNREAAVDWLEENPTAYPGWDDIRAAVQTKREATYPDWARFEGVTRGKVARGFIMGNPEQAGTYILGLDPQLADIATTVHEWGHFLHDTNNPLGPKKTKEFYEWAGYDLTDLPDFKTREEFLDWSNTQDGVTWRKAEEKIARAFEVYVMEGGGDRLDPAAKKAMKALADHMDAAYDTLGRRERVATYNEAGLANTWESVPGHIKDVFDYWLTHEEIKGGKLVYPEGVEVANPGKFYVPYKRGLPVSVLHPYRTGKAYVMMRRAFPKTGAVGAGGVDASLKHEYKAALLLSGAFDNSQIAKANIDGLQKAVNLQSMHEVREGLLAKDAGGNYMIASVIPRQTDDIAVKVNPTQKSAPELKRIQEYLGQMERGEKVSITDLAKEDEAVFEMLAKDMFGGKLSLAHAGKTKVELGQVEGRNAKDVAADIIDKVMEPVDNIVWVPRRFLDNVGIFEPPRLAKEQGKVKGTIGGMADLVNDYLKVSMLYLNPHYYGMNLVGNGVMNLLHEGVWAPINLSRAFWIHHQLGEEVAFIDFMMGHGLMSVAELRSMNSLASGRKVAGAMAHYSGVVVDMIPRRAAFIHEARRQGFRKAEDISRLMDDPDALFLVVQKAKRAMVDFDDLSPFERDVMSRYIFVYPWLKGATMQTARFPKEHPIVTAGMIWGYNQQQELAGGDEPLLTSFMPTTEEAGLTGDIGGKIGPRPTYLDLILPIGVVERYGDKYPLVVNMRQVFTASTPYEIARNIEAFITGNPNGEALSEMLQPWYGSLLTAMTGWDPFRHQEVPRGFPTLLKALDPREAPGIQSLQKLLRSDAEREADAQNGRLYPRNRTDDILNFWLGSVGASPVNPETARERAQVGPKSSEQKLQDWSDEVKQATGDPADPYMAAVKANRLRYEELKREAKVRTIESDEERARVETKAKLQVYIELNPSFEVSQEKWEAQIDATPLEHIQKWNDWLEKGLGWDHFNAYQRRVDKWIRYKERVDATP